METFQELLNDPVTDQVVTEILSDIEFKNRCLTKIRAIFDDAQLDVNDIPIIVTLLIDVYNSYKTVRVDKENFRNIFKLLIYRLFQELGFLENMTESDSALVEMAVDGALTLLTTNVDYKKIRGCWKKTFPCCFPDKDVEQVEDVSIAAERLCARRRDLARQRSV